MFKQANMKLKESARIEFWIVTGCIVLAFLLSLIDAVRLNNLISASLIPVLFNYLIIYISYLLLCFYVTPAFEKREGAASAGTSFVLILISAGVLMRIINIYFAALLAIKILLIFFNRNKENKENSLYYEAALLVASWILTIAALHFLSTHILFHFYIYYVIPVAILLYLFAMYRLIPKIMLKKKRRFLHFFGRMLLLTFASCLIVLIALNLFVSSESYYIEVTVMNNFLTQLLIVVPFSWSIYQGRNEKRTEEIKLLKTELGKSDANLNFLKSQINPHFLFNALNTLYGTALQENAERTGEGIQKLGDMMRFMLQENMQDKIPLSRDIDYLKNYILLQKLRTSVSPDITIQTQIEYPEKDLLIAPMLLIPFVENAFKHGISLLNPSHIKITLQTHANTLYFDVHNSIHIKAENDSEKEHSGIGLENVKQRLLLLYPGKHELIIRETAKEFFVHLTLQLEINS